MTKIRVALFALTIFVVGILGLYASYYARGYRLNFKTFKFEPNGILVIKSEPDGASVFINGGLKTATNATLSLPPGAYDVEVKKDGYLTWRKRLVIEKEIVTTAAVSLFKQVPSLSPLTFSGAKNPITSDDGTKIAFSVPPSANAGNDKIGIYTMDTFNLPLGFTNEPKKITDGDMSKASYQFSPDNRQILITASNGIFLIDSESFTPQSQMINVASQKDSILKSWEIEKKKKDASLIKNLPSPLSDILVHKTLYFAFSPDQNMILYSASGSANLPDNLIKPLPGSSTQKQSRSIEDGKTYVYDIKEDRNFLISEQKIIVDSATGALAVRWLPSSRHLLVAEPNKITVMDYDGTNKTVVYSGVYEYPYVFPYANATKLLVLTNLGGDSAATNLYVLTVK